MTSVETKAEKQKPAVATSTLRTVTEDQVRSNAKRALETFDFFQKSPIWMIGFIYQVMHRLGPGAIILEYGDANDLLSEERHRSLFSAPGVGGGHWVDVAELRKKRHDVIPARALQLIADCDIHAFVWVVFLVRGNYQLPQGSKSNFPTGVGWTSIMFRRFRGPVDEWCAQSTWRTLIYSTCPVCVLQEQKLHHHGQQQQQQQELRYLSDVTVSQQTDKDKTAARSISIARLEERLPCGDCFAVYYCGEDHRTIHRGAHVDCKQLRENHGWAARLGEWESLYSRMEHVRHFFNHSMAHLGLIGPYDFRTKAPPDMALLDQRIQLAKSLDGKASGVPAVAVTAAAEAIAVSALADSVAQKQTDAMQLLDRQIGFEATMNSPS